MANDRGAFRQLGCALATGAMIVIADMTGTRFCDSTGLRALVLAHKQAAAYCRDWSRLRWQAVSGQRLGGHADRRCRRASPRRPPKAVVQGSGTRFQQTAGGLSRIGSRPPRPRFRP